MPDNLTNLPEFTVSEISQAVKRTLEGRFERIRVRGEISGFKRATSGHLYFALKDEESKLDGVCWRMTAQRLAIAPEDGLEVIATGRISSYPGRSSYQLIIDSLELAGEGALLKLLEDRRKKLASEGLFDLERKKVLPFLPAVIGVVTSPTGAVIRDILHRLRDRFPRHVLIWPVPVQGEGAKEQIAAAIAGFNAIVPGGRVPRPDLLIVARGGGSLEDLWAFNEEIVVRAAAASDLPLISAVGHETDTTLIDFAADVRAPTPTAAAEMAVPVRADLLADVQQDGARLVRALRRLSEESRLRLEGLARGLPRPGQFIAEKMQALDVWIDRLANAHIGYFERRWQDISISVPRPEQLIRARRAELGQFGERLDGAITVALKDKSQRLVLARLDRNRLKQMLAGLADRLERFGQLLDSVSYQKILARGFALIRDSRGQPVLAAAAVVPGAALSIQFTDGVVGVTADAGGGAKRPAAKSEPAKSATPKPGGPKPDAPQSDAPQSDLPKKQGSLF
ncbi:MAG TPA: exodeoxyribonuclease VII large subunit [Dongiaceae bacterium]|nr:exodeoxyribonuclease VII large subunit [Dongiaceae bacterium]